MKTIPDNSHLSSLFNDIEFNTETSSNTRIYLPVSADRMYDRNGNEFGITYTLQWGSSVLRYVLYSDNKRAIESFHLLNIEPGLSERMDRILGGKYVFPSFTGMLYEVVNEVILQIAINNKEKLKNMIKLYYDSVFGKSSHVEEKITDSEFILSYVNGGLVIDYALEGNILLEKRWNVL